MFYWHEIDKLDLHFVHIYLTHLFYFIFLFHQGSELDEKEDDESEQRNLKKQKV